MQKSASHFYGNIPISEEKNKNIFLIFSKKDERKLTNFKSAPKARTNQRLENLTCFVSTNKIAKLLFRRRSWILLASSTTFFLFMCWKFCRRKKLSLSQTNPNIFSYPISWASDISNHSVWSNNKSLKYQRCKPLHRWFQPPPPEWN